MADNALVRRTSLIMALAWLSLGAAIREKGIAPAPRPALGLAVNLPSRATPAERTRALAEVRRSGVSLFALPVSWSAGEPSAGQYRIADVTRTARLLRQSGALLHLDLPLVAGRVRDVPRDLAAIPFDDSRLSLRLGRFLEALSPALLDFATVSLGYQADSYFADKPDELRAFRRLFDGAVQFLQKKAPHLRVGVTTSTPNESPAPAVAEALHQRSPVLFYVYAPFVRGSGFEHRSPGAIERDWKQLLDRAGGRPIAFPEVSFSSAKENRSSPLKQAEFIRRFRRFLASGDGRRLLYARYVPWRDPSDDEEAEGSALGRRAFLANRGLQTAAGVAKPAWREWERAGASEGSESRVRSPRP